MSEIKGRREDYMTINGAQVPVVSERAFDWRGHRTGWYVCIDEVFWYYSKLESEDEARDVATSQWGRFYGKIIQTEPLADRPADFDEEVPF